MIIDDQVSYMGKTEQMDTLEMKRMCELNCWNRRRKIKVQNVENSKDTNLQPMTEDGRSMRVRKRYEYKYLQDMKQEEPAKKRKKSKKK